VSHELILEIIASCSILLEEFVIRFKQILWNVQVSQLNNTPGSFCWLWWKANLLQIDFLFQVGKYMEFGTLQLSLMAEKIFLDQEEHRVAGRW